MEVLLTRLVVTLVLMVTLASPPVLVIVPYSVLFAEIQHTVMSE